GRAPAAASDRSRRRALRLDRRRLDRREGSSRCALGRARRPLSGLRLRASQGLRRSRALGRAAPLRPLPRAPPDVPRRRAGHRGAAARTRAGEAARPPPRPRFPIRSASRLTPYASRAAQTRLKSTEMATNRDQLLQSAEKHVSRGKLDQALKDYLRVL